LKATVSDIALQVKGTVKGDGSATVNGAAGLAEAKSSDISFLKADVNAPTLKLFRETKAAAVIVPKGFNAEGKTVIECEDPMMGFAQVLGLIARESQVRPEGIHASAVVHPTATLGKNVRIGAHSIIEENAVIGDGVCLMGQVYIGARSKVGNDSFFYPQVVLREDVSVGQRCILHAGAVIGSDGFGFFFAGGRHNKIAQVGSVIVEDDVEIGSCTTIDRATTGVTRIGRGTKVDNLVQVAHNVQVGPLCLLVAQSGIAGSTRLGTGVVLAGQAGVADHLTIGDGVKAGARAGINRDVEKGQMVWGTPAQPLTDELKQVSLLRKLPALFKEFKKLRESLERNG